MTLELAISHIPLVVLSALAFWKPNAPLFMIVGAIAFFTGLKWFDVYTTDTGLTISLMEISYGFVAWGLAFRCIFIRERGENGS